MLVFVTGLCLLAVEVARAGNSLGRALCSFLTKFKFLRGLKSGRARCNYLTKFHCKEFWQLLKYIILTTFN